MLAWGVFFVLCAVVGAQEEQCQEKPNVCEQQKSEFDWREVQTLSTHPRVFYYPHFLTESECDELIRVGSPHLKSSKTDVGHRPDLRNSYATYLRPEAERNEIIAAVRTKAHIITQIPLENFEPLQIQRYQAPTTASPSQQFYKPHTDTATSHVPSRRIATWVFYLSDVEAGGETVFPLTKIGNPARAKTNFGDNHDDAIAYAMHTWEDVCGENLSNSLSVRPRKGAAVLFYSLTPSSQLDTLSVHGSCPVTNGTKWISQQWIREEFTSPRFSPHLFAYYDFRTIENGIIPSHVGSHPLHVLGSIPSGRIDFSNVLEGCSQPSQDISSRISVSDAFSVTFLVAIDQCNKGRESSSIVLSSGGAADNCCQFRISISKNCGIAVFGMDREGARVQVSGRLSVGTTHVSVVVNREYTDITAKDDPTIWRYQIDLVIDNTVTTSAPLRTLKNTAATATTICVTKGEHLTFREIYMFDHSLSDFQRQQVTVVSQIDNNLSGA